MGSQHAVAPTILCADTNSINCAWYLCIDGLILLIATLGSLLVISFQCLLRRQRYHQIASVNTNLHSGATSSSSTSAKNGAKELPSPRVILEISALLIETIVSFALILLAARSEACPMPSIWALFDVYLLLLIAARGFGSIANLKSYSAYLYCIRWTLAVWEAVSMSIQYHRQLSIVTAITHLCLFTTLCLSHFDIPYMSTQATFHYRGSRKSAGISLSSRFSFQWINGLVWKAFRKPLEIDDLYGLDQRQECATTSRYFHAAAEHSLPLLSRIFHFLKSELFHQGAWAAVVSVTTFVPPILIRILLLRLESPASIAGVIAWLCVAGLLASGLITSIADCQCNWKGRQISAKLRAILVNEIYLKSLRQSISKSTTKPVEPEGQASARSVELPAEENVVNLISVDTEAVSEISGNLFLVWVTFPIQISLGTFLLYYILGISGVLGVTAMVFLLPLNLLLSKKLMSVQAQVLTASDARVQASNELLHNIRTIKYCAWERPFEERVLGKRRPELKEMRSRLIWWSISMTFFYSLPFIVTIATCFFYTVVWGNALGTSVAFPALTIFTIMRIPLNRLADSITFIAQAHVSLKRIERFLQRLEVAKSTEPITNDLFFVGFKNASLKWPVEQCPHVTNDDLGRFVHTQSPQPFVLCDLQIQFKRHSLNLVCGPSGSGKSSLLLALLGELELISGTTHLPTDPTSTYLISESRLIGYCPQEPWIMNRSVRWNILLGSEFDGIRYEAVLEAVALKQDLASLDEGDQTLAGERGNRLSGGQKQRVALARALYSRSSYVILDDCLSALDAQTASYIFRFALLGSLMQGRTCILATHDTQLTAHADHIVVLNSGRVLSQGSGENFWSKNPLKHSRPRNDLPATLPVIQEEPPSEKTEASSFNEPSFSPGCQNLETRPLDKEAEAYLLKDEVQYRETKAEGAIPLSVVWEYLKAMGSWYYWLAALAGFLAQQLLALGTNLWMKEWAFQYDSLALGLTGAPETGTDVNQQPHRVAAGYYLAIYTALCVSYALITLLRDLFVLHGSLSASSLIYQNLLGSVLYAKLLFFDRVPLGQITNRLSRDVEILDQHIATFSTSALQIAISLAVTLVLIGSTMPIFVPVAITIFLAYSCVVSIYVCGARDFKRIEAAARSPLYQQFEESAQGRVSIRAYTQASIFVRQNSDLVDKVTQAYLLLWAGKEWLTFRIGVLSSIITFLLGAYVLWNIETVNPGIAGLTLAYAVRFTESVLWLAQIYAIIQQNLTSVERIAEYMALEKESVVFPSTPKKVVPSSWPTRGEVRFHDYSTRYAPELKPVLVGINLSIKPGERLAVVGRTGAGKSTVALALIRGVEACDGHIEVDGINISSLSHERLRKAVTIIPQDPELFEGSLRDNLTPLRDRSDEELLESLNAVQLLGISKPGQIIYADLEKPASSLSRGHRQLLCIARGLLRRSQLLVLDEATASVDYETDEAIKTSLRASAAAGVTVITIAHRLLSIADYDRVIVLDAGHLVEQGRIRDLLSFDNGTTLFRRLCEESGNIGKIEQAAA